MTKIINFTHIRILTNNMIVILLHPKMFSNLERLYALGLSGNPCIDRKFEPVQYKKLRLNWESADMGYWNDESQNWKAWRHVLKKKWKITVENLNIFRDCLKTMPSATRKMQESCGNFEKIWRENICNDEMF